MESQDDNGQYTRQHDFGYEPSFGRGFETVPAVADVSADALDYTRNRHDLFCGYYSGSPWPASALPLPQHHEIFNSFGSGLYHGGFPTPGIFEIATAATPSSNLNYPVVPAIPEPDQALTPALFAPPQWDVNTWIETTPLARCLELPHPTTGCCSPKPTPSDATATPSTVCAEIRPRGKPARPAEKEPDQDQSPQYAWQDAGNEEAPSPTSRRDKYREYHREAGMRSRLKERRRKELFEHRTKDLQVLNAELVAEERALVNEKMALMEELFLHAACNDRVIDEYLAFAAQQV